MAAVPLDNTDEHCKDMNGVLLTFLSICSFVPRAFATGMIFRGGLDVGIATKIKETNETDGSAVVKAIELENDVAEYPRIVIGDGLLDFLRVVQNQVPQTKFGDVAKTYAGICRRMIVQDTDGLKQRLFSRARVKNVDRLSRHGGMRVGWRNFRA